MAFCSYQQSRRSETGPRFPLLIAAGGHRLRYAPCFRAGRVDGSRGTSRWLVVTSVLYGWWNPRFVLLVGSIFASAIGQCILRLT